MLPWFFKLYVKWKFWVVTKKISKGKIHYIRQWLRENTYPKRQHLGLWKYLLTSQLWLAMKSSLLLTPEPTNRSIRTARKKIKMALKKKKKKENGMKQRVQICYQGIQIEPLIVSGILPFPCSNVSFRKRKEWALFQLSTFGPGSPHYELQHWEVSQEDLTLASTSHLFKFLGRTSFFIFIKKITNTILLLHLSRTLMEKAHQSSKVFVCLAAEG